MPKISVIVPVYRVEEYIERCARSLFEQTLDDIEFLFIDDCSPDRSISILLNVLEEYPKRRAQVTIHHMDQNSGQAKVREWGIKHANGDYIIHCDSDDWVDCSMYQSMYEKAISDKADVVISDYHEWDDKGFIQYRTGCTSLMPSKLQSDMMYVKSPWSLWNKLFRTEIYAKIKYFPSGNMGEDMLLCLQMIYYCKKVSHIAKGYYYYFQNPKSIVNNCSIESTLSKYYQNNSNLLLLHKFYIENNSDKQLSKEFRWLQYFVKSILFIGDPRLRSIIKTAYPNIELFVIFDRNINVHIRFSCFKNYIKILLGLI